MLPAALRTLGVPGSVTIQRRPKMVEVGDRVLVESEKVGPSPGAAWSPPSRTGSLRCAGTPAQNRSSSQAPGPCRSLVTTCLRGMQATLKSLGRGVDAPPRLGAWVANPIPSSLGRSTLGRPERRRRSRDLVCTHLQIRRLVLYVQPVRLSAVCAAQVSGRVQPVPDIPSGDGWWTATRTASCAGRGSQSSGNTVYWH